MSALAQNEARTNPGHSRLSVSTASVHRKTVLSAVIANEILAKLDEDIDEVMEGMVFYEWLEIL